MAWWTCSHERFNTDDTGRLMLAYGMLSSWSPCGTQAGTVHMDWREYIHSDATVLVGKPVVRGTRLAVDFILELFAAGWTEQQVLESYPSLTSAALRAVFAFAGECVRDEALYTAASDAASGGREYSTPERAATPAGQSRCRRDHRRDARCG